MYMYLGQVLPFGLLSSHWSRYSLSVLSLLLEKIGALGVAQNWAQLEAAGKMEEAVGKEEEDVAGKEEAAERGEEASGKEEEATGKEEEVEEGRRCLTMVWESLQWGWLRFGSEVQSAVSCQRDHQQDWQLPALQH